MIDLPLLIPHTSLCVRKLRDEPEEYALLAQWLNDPRVLEFYEGRDQFFTPEKVRTAFQPKNGSDNTCLPCLIERAGHPLGYVQICQLTPEDKCEYGLDADSLVYGLDLFIGEPDLWGQGIGRRVVSAVTEALFAAGVGWVTLDPQVNNLRAQRCYAACGFQIIKRLPAHELHEGRWVDCLLMARQAECG